MNTGKLFLIVVLIGLIVSCTPSGKKEALMPTISGKTYEILLLMDKDLWAGETGKIFKDILLAECPGLPQPEPMFDVMQIPGNAFTKLFRVHRNIIKTRISSEVEKPVFAVKKDVWAKEQLYIKIEAPDKKSFAKLVEKNKEKIINFVLDKEMQRTIAYYKKYPNRTINEKLSKAFNINMQIPASYDLYDLKDNFAWIRNETNSTSQSILVYSYNYADTSAFHKDNLLQKRDSVLQARVNGPSAGNFMTTEYLFEPMYREIMLQKKYATEIRGLWKMDRKSEEYNKDFMGGPFISLSTVDEKNNKVITVEGFVYAGRQDKRNLLRQVEAILYTLEMVEKQ